MLSDYFKESVKRFVEENKETEGDLRVKFFGNVTNTNTKCLDIELEDISNLVKEKDLSPISELASEIAKRIIYEKHSLVVDVGGELLYPDIDENFIVYFNEEEDCVKWNEYFQEEFDALYDEWFATIKEMLYEGYF